MLGFSRTHVAKLVDAGILPGRKLHRHRRIRTTDVMAFKREMERKLALLDELSALSQEMGLYDTQVFEV